MLTLFELNALVRHTIESALPEDYWVEAEIAEISESRGHCYMDLVQRQEGLNTPIARAQAKCWRQTWMVLGPLFSQTCGQPLRAGLKVLLKVYAQFHEAYGFSWIVSDIDPKYTLGDLVQRRQEIINRLREEGVFDLNKTLPMPLFSQRVAVISSGTAAGYGDFQAQLQANPYGYAFKAELFQATMQGELVESSIIGALNRIFQRAEEFDVVVIIRGGGAQSDMQGFDSYLLALNLCQFPLPIITGIGHDRDECILDMVAHTRVKTPTAAAALLIERLREADARLGRALEALARVPMLRLSEARARLSLIESRLAATAMMSIERGRHAIDILEQRALSQDPLRLLQRGYTITTLSGHILTSADGLKKGDEIETLMAGGRLKSTITDVYGDNKI